jgi:hypothetical protein
MTGLKKMILDVQTADGINYCTNCERMHIDLIFYEEKLLGQRFL